MSKITYENKVALNVNSDIADINKCNASDLNEIKNVVNTNDDNTTNNSNAIGTLSSLNTTNKSNLVGAINEVNQNDINKGTYSTTEQVVGKWTNNKPIYRKVINTGQINLSTTAVEKDSNISNVDIIKDINLMLMFQSGTQVIWYTNWNISELSFDKSTQKIVIIGTKSSSFINSFVVIEYTKTTD